jgi:hypothetical protein
VAFAPPPIGTPLYPAEIACTVQEFPIDIVLTRDLIEQGYDLFVPVYFMLTGVDGRNYGGVRVVGAASGAIVAAAGFGSPGHARVPRIKLNHPPLHPVEVQAGGRVLTFGLSGLLFNGEVDDLSTAMFGAAHPEMAPEGSGMPFNATFECEIELEAGMQYTVHGQMIGPEVRDGFYFWMEEQTTGTIVYPRTRVNLARAIYLSP